MKQKTGLELIAQERKEQQEKHGWHEAHDDQHRNGELAKVATCIISKNYINFPESWGGRYAVKFMCKDRLEALTVAGALIAAEIDRLQRIESQ